MGNKISIRWTSQRCYSAHIIGKGFIYNVNTTPLLIMLIILIFGFSCPATARSTRLSHQGIHYRIIDLGYAHPCAINNRGVIAGTVVSDNRVDYAARWLNGSWQILSGPRGETSEACTINYNNDIAGLFRDSGFLPQPIIWMKQKPMAVPKRYLVGIANASDNDGKTYVVSGEHGTVWTFRNNRFWGVSLPGIFEPTCANVDLVAGIKSNVVRGNEGPIIVLDKKGVNQKWSVSGLTGYPCCISNNGWMTGALVTSSYSSGETSCGFIAKQKLLLKVVAFGSVHTALWSINRYGVCVGYCFLGRKQFAIVFRSGKSILMNKLVQNKDWNFEEARGINDKGMIVGNGMHNGVKKAFLAVPIP